MNYELIYKVVREMREGLSKLDGNFNALNYTLFQMTCCTRDNIRALLNAFDAQSATIARLERRVAELEAQLREAQPFLDMLEAYDDADKAMQAFLASAKGA